MAPQRLATAFPKAINKGFICLLSRTKQEFAFEVHRLISKSRINLATDVIAHCIIMLKLLELQFRDVGGVQGLAVTPMFAKSRSLAIISSTVYVAEFPSEL